MILQLLNIFTLLLFIPIGILIFYLTKHLHDKNGEVGKLRKIILFIKIGWLIYLFSRIGGTFLIKAGWTIDQIAIFLIIGMLPIVIVHWWALFIIKRQILKKNTDMI